MRVELSQVIDRPPAEVFRFIVTDHVRNHPRWDPNMHLEQVAPGPIGVGTVIRRRYMMGDRQVEGEMEVVEYEPDRAFGVVIRDGPAEFRSRITFEPAGEGSTRQALTLESDAPVKRMDPGPIQRSLDRMKELIESDA
ncbi:MAG: SRPBCC family protein [Actinomycetota bacterium]